MNIPPPPTIAFPADVLREARQIAAEHQRSVVDELVLITGRPPAEVLGSLALTFNLQSVSLAEMRGWQAAFDLVPLAKAMRRECLLFRDGERLIGVIHDPFETATQQWLASLLTERIDMALATRADVQSYLGNAEIAARAMGSAVAPASSMPAAKIRR